MIDFSRKKKLGLVLSGGAVKAAAFHVGVALALEQKGFRFLGGTRDNRLADPLTDITKTFQVYVGSSAGSLVTTFLAQGGRLRDLVASFQSSKEETAIPGMKYWEMLSPRFRRATDIRNLKNYLWSMLRERSLQSPFSTAGIKRYLEAHVLQSDAFSDLEPDLFIVATELNQSKKAIFGRYKALSQDPYLEYRDDVAVGEACAASMSIPPVFHPYELKVDGQIKEYFDGEIREPLSTHVARDAGCDLIVCSYTHQPVRLRHGSLSQMGVEEVVLQAVYQAIEQKIQLSRGTRQRERALVDRIRKFFLENQLSDALCDQLIEEVESRLSYKSEVDYIYINPRASDLEMYRLPHFSLQKSKTEKIVRKGFVAAMSALRGLNVGA